MGIVNLPTEHRNLGSDGRRGKIVGNTAPQASPGSAIPGMEKQAFLIRTVISKKCNCN